MIGWTSRMVASLAAAKAAGYTFENAWAGALLENPPGRREVGQVQLTLYGKRDESLEEAFQRFCDDAWHGRRPLLRHLPGLMAGLVDDHSVVAVDGAGGRTRAQLVA